MMADEEFNDEGSEGSWQIFIGKSFGAALTYDTYKMIHFDLKAEQKTFLLFKTQWQFIYFFIMN